VKEKKGNKRREENKSLRQRWAFQGSRLSVSHAIATPSLGDRAGVGEPGGMIRSTSH
jgi:hypothetical protein